MWKSTTFLWRHVRSASTLRRSSSRRSSSSAAPVTSIVFTTTMPPVSRHRACHTLVRSPTRTCTRTHTRRAHSRRGRLRARGQAIGPSGRHQLHQVQRIGRTVHQHRACDATWRALHERLVAGHPIGAAHAHGHEPRGNILARQRAAGQASSVAAESICWAVTTHVVTDGESSGSGCPSQTVPLPPSPISLRGGETRRGQRPRGAHAAASTKGLASEERAQSWAARTPRTSAPQCHRPCPCPSPCPRPC